nr:hypothetical protein [Tanacetum cinerariifolium]
MAIDGVGWDWSCMTNEGEHHALVADGETPTEFALMANTENKVKEGVGYNAVPPPAVDLYFSPKKDLSWTGLPEFNLDNLIESQRSDKVKDGVGYNDVPPPAVDLYLSPKKDLSWTGLPEFFDDTVTDYSRPSPNVASTSAE